MGGLKAGLGALACLLLAGAASAATLPPLPSGWPEGLPLGAADSPGGAAALRATSALGLRYQYLSGGVANGWALWGNGQFVHDYVRESVLHGFIPVFSYYMLLQSGAGGGSEGDIIAANLQNAGLMAAYFGDLRRVFEQTAAFPGSPVVLHVEPDLWGHLHQRGGDDGAGIPVKVGATGVAELAGLPDTLSGFARALGVLRDRYAPHVLLAYHMSVWGTRADFAAANSSDAEVDQLAIRAAAFFRSIGGPFDLVFGEFSDRDAGFKQLVEPRDGGASWWDAEDFRRHVRFLATFVAVARTRVVLWQIPLGNTRMLAMNNTWNHYQDNRVEWLLDDPGRGHLQAYVQAGVVGFLFGRGTAGTTCACDASGDGVTNPAPINGNTRPSLSADDDGGFFRDRAAAYYAAGALALVPGPAPPPASASRGTPFDWDGDGRADVAVFGPAAGEWRLLGSAAGGATTAHWGNAALGDGPVPADYDGDGRTDLAVVRQPTGEWFIHRSSDGGLLSLAWGSATFGDLPVPADYDGDGRADVGVFRPVTGEWFIHRSSDGGLLQAAWGAGGLDVPVPADYDGDGRADLAVFRPATGEWFILRTSDGGLSHARWGSGPAGDGPVPADYDGDGRADLAVYRQPTGEWFVLRSSDGGLIHVPFGAPGFGDLPVPADYFGAGRAQIAVYRTTTGQWFLADPAGGARVVGWGVPELGERPAR